MKKIYKYLGQLIKSKDKSTIVFICAKQNVGPFRAKQIGIKRRR